MEDEKKCDMLGEMNNNVQSGAENKRENWKRKK